LAEIVVDINHGICSSAASRFKIAIFFAMEGPAPAIHRDVEIESLITSFRSNATDELFFLFINVIATFLLKLIRSRIFLIGKIYIFLTSKRKENLNSYCLLLADSPVAKEPGRAGTGAEKKDE
jgi:hypothetical protein